MWRPWRLWRLWWLWRERGLAAAADGAALRTVGDSPFSSEGFQHSELEEKQFPAPRECHIKEAAVAGMSVGAGRGGPRRSLPGEGSAAVFVQGLGGQQLLVMAGYFWQVDVWSVRWGQRRSPQRRGRPGGGAVACILKGFICGSDPPADRKPRPLPDVQSDPPDSRTKL